MANINVVGGMDFGTTFSAVCFAFLTEPDDVDVVKNYPGNQGRTSHKTPTLIKYLKGAVKAAGFEARTGERRPLEGFKLLIDPSHQGSVYLGEGDVVAELAKLKKTPADVTADYITWLKDHAIADLKSRHAEGFLDKMHVQWVLTVPAIWSDAAKAATLRAAEKAGIVSVQVIKEPEAAALCVLHNWQGKCLQVGDVWILCDAGGGTTDLIAYEISCLQPLQLKEVTPATGCLAGSLKINRRFEDHVRRIIGDRDFRRLEHTDAFKRAMKTFDENVKPGFESEDSEDFVTFPKAALKDNVAEGLSHNTLTLSGTVLYHIFKPIVDDVIQEIAGQIARVRLRRHGLPGKNPRGVILVGGLGTNQYLHKQIKEHFPDIEVIQPKDAWSAVVRGAVISRIPGRVSVTVNYANKHYGVKCQCPYNASTDRTEEKFWDKHGGSYRINGMDWHIKIGDELERARTISLPFFRTFDERPDLATLCFTEVLYECTQEHAPRSERDAEIQQNASLSVDFSGIPPTALRKRNRFDVRTQEYISFYRFDFNIVVKVGSGPMQFSVEVDGEEYGSVTTEY